MVKLIRFTGRLATSDTVYELIEAKEAKNYYSYEGKRYSKKTGIIKVKGQGRSADRRINNWEIVSPITEESDKYYYAPLISGNAVIDKTTLHIVHPEGYYTQKVIIPRKILKNGKLKKWLKGGKHETNSNG